MRKLLIVLACFASAFASAQLGMGAAQPMELAGAHLCGPFSPGCSATIANEQKDPPGFILRKDVSEVRVQFSVTDKFGHHVSALSKNDFALSDNRVKIDELTDFREESDLPIQVAIDSSRSTERELPMEKQLALEFLRNLLRPQDRAMIAGFNTHPRILGSFTSHFDQLENSVGILKAEGLTASTIRSTRWRMILNHRLRRAES